jgi:hypothetical protein
VTEGTYQVRVDVQSRPCRLNDRTTRRGAPMKQGMGGTMIIAGYVLGGLNYLITSLVFFSRGDTLLGLIQLVIPPAELVLPWVAHPTLGVISLVSLGLIIAGSNTIGD